VSKIKKREVFMKNIILLEDRPEKLASVIRQVGEEFEGEAAVTKVLYYSNSDGHETDIENLREKLNVEVDVVDLWNFDDKLEEIYQENEDNLFVFDTDIYAKPVEIFEFRVNISFALKKKEAGRIWFYTEAGPYFKDNILKLFPQNVLKVQRKDSNQVTLQFSDNPEFMNKIRE